jgi:hypothetical protein
VNWLAACIALRVVGAVLVVLLCRGERFAQSSSQWPMIPEKMSQTFLLYKIIGAPKKITKLAPSPI